MSGVSPEINFDYIMSKQFIIDVESGKVDINIKLSGRTALMFAIEKLSVGAKSNNTYKRVKKLIELGSDLEARNNHRQTAIHYACKAGSVGALKLILDTVASWTNENTKYLYINDSGSGCTPLYYTCEKGHRKMTQMLINAGVNIEQRTGPQKMPAVYYAAMHGHLRVVKKFPFEMLAKSYPPATSLQTTNTILCGAVTGNELDVVDWLLWTVKAPVHIEGPATHQPIEVAAELYEHAIFRTLVPYLTDREMVFYLENWIATGRKELFEIVIVQFDKRHLKSPIWTNPRNFLIGAIEINRTHLLDKDLIRRKTDMAFALIDRGEPVNPTLKSTKFWWTCQSPLTIAIRNRNEDLVRYLLEKKADPNLGLSFKPLGSLACQIYPSFIGPSGRVPTRWEPAWNLMKLCLDNGADPDEIVDHRHQHLPDYLELGLFTCMIYKSYLHVDRRNEEEKALRTEIFREFVKRGLGFNVDWHNTRDKPSKLVAELLTSSGLWSGAEYDEEEEIYVIDKDIVATRCPSGCQFYGCERTETPIRINTEGCKHIFCAGHVRKMIQMNKKINRERRRGVGGNQLTLKCPVCRAEVKDFQLMSIKQVKNWKRFERMIKLNEREETELLEEPNMRLRAIYKTFKAPLDKKQLALKRVRERVEQLEKEIKEMEEKQEKSAKPFLEQKKIIQSAAIDLRKEYRDKQFTNRVKINF